MKKFTKIVDKLCRKIFTVPHFESLLTRYHVIRNINYSSETNQKRVLICYLTEPLFSSASFFSSHAKYYQMLQIMNYFIKDNFIIDICNYVNKDSIGGLDCAYDIIIGQGIAYDTALTSLKFDKSILFLTENVPSVVEKKYNERLAYFKDRHPDISANSSSRRSGIFQTDTIKRSDNIIAIGSKHNLKQLAEINSNIYPITVNTSKNNNVTYSSDRVIRNKKNFVWFGSVGLIHKGLDILIDVFREMPECTLNVYGVPKSELSLFKKLKCSNTILHPTVDILSERFVNEVVNNNGFILSPSCSEGIQTGVATCMRCGMIPIVSTESGFDPTEGIVILKDCKVETIKETLLEWINKSDEQIAEASRKAWDFSNEHYTNKRFTEELFDALNKII